MIRYYDMTYFLKNIFLYCRLKENKDCIISSSIVVTSCFETSHKYRFSNLGQ
ncbi:hypothetical protein CKA32_003852 [Geitlerinema sp. FC II]|nr:hypothetical protein CKA32_003852 [Geitlerinema sp. FC II]